MTGFFSNYLNKYHSLSSNRVESENYEIIKLINGPVLAILYNEQTHTTLVLADRYLWKINSAGYITDTYFGTSSLYNSGISRWSGSWGAGTDECHWYSKYNDWLYSGDKTEHEIIDIEDSRDMSDAERIARFDKADIVEFFSYYKANGNRLKVCLLKEGDRWTVLNINDHSGGVDGDYKEYALLNNTICKESHLKGYDKKYKNKLIELEKNMLYDYDCEDKNKSLQLVKFVRKFYYFEGGFLGWLLEKLLCLVLSGSSSSSYWYGTGRFQLNHHSEALRFKALVSKEDEIEFSNASIYRYSEGVNDDSQFIKITYLGGEHELDRKEAGLVKYHEEDVGLYVIRKKIRSQEGAVSAKNISDINSDQKLIYATRNCWSPAFTGMFAGGHPHEKSIWGDICFLNTDIDPRHYLMSASAVQPGMNFIPRSMSFEWIGFDLVCKLYLNEENIVWLYSRLLSDGVFFELNFDETEISNAFSQLDKANRPIQLVLHIEEIETATATLKVSLINGRENIELKKITYRYTDSVYRDNSEAQSAVLFARSKLEVEYKRALKNSLYLESFFDASISVVERMPCAKTYSYAMANYTIKLILAYIKKADHVSAKKCVYHYANKLLPLAGAHELTDDISSNGLFLAMTDKDNDMMALIFEKLLGKKYDLRVTKNHILLFNLACYYARKKDKVKMLQAVKQSLLHGMKAEQFISENDLKDYWSDADFIAVFNN